MDPDGCRDLADEDQALLLKYLGIDNPADWENSWRWSGVIESTAHHWPDAARSDWLWSLGLPILTEAQQHRDKRWLIGLSAMPGCGKTSLGRWLEAAATHLGLSLQVVSIDDFYFSAEKLEHSMRGNPWGVPRALPGSHEIDLLNSTIRRWKAGEKVLHPVFDKALRQGRGDRSGWRSCSADVLVLEGWFVGISPSGMDGPPSKRSDGIDPPLTDQEWSARRIVQRALRDYIPVWNEMNSLWQLRTLVWDSPKAWKLQQEERMKLQRGSGLNPDALNGFTRMITSAIPETSFNEIESDVCFEVDPERRLRHLRVRF